MSGATQVEINSFVNDACLHTHLHCTYDDEQSKQSGCLCIQLILGVVQAVLNSAPGRLKVHYGC